MCLPSTVTAQTLDHQQLDISGSLGTNPASPGDFAGKNLSKHSTLSVGDPLKDDKFRSPKLHNSDTITQLKFDSKLTSGVPGREQRPSNVPKKSLNVTVRVFPCPDETDIAPCVCTFTDSTDLTMDCSAVESEAQLAAIFTKSFPDNKFKQFQIYNNDKIQFLSDVFNGVSFRYIRLYDVPKLTEITNYAFADSMDVLENIYIRNSSLSEDTFPFSSLDTYPKLTNLYIAFCDIYFFPTFTSSSLQTLIIAYGHISVLLEGKMCDRLF